MKIINTCEILLSFFNNKDFDYNILLVLNMVTLLLNKIPGCLIYNLINNLKRKYIIDLELELLQI